MIIWRILHRHGLDHCIHDLFRRSARLALQHRFGVVIGIGIFVVGLSSDVVLNVITIVFTPMVSCSSASTPFQLTLAVVVISPLSAI